MGSCVQCLPLSGDGAGPVAIGLLENTVSVRVFFSGLVKPLSVS